MGGWKAVDEDDDISLGAWKTVNVEPVWFEIQKWRGNGGMREWRLSQFFFILFCSYNCFVFWGGDCGSPAGVGKGVFFIIISDSPVPPRIDN